jgi:hypothetical protein
MGDKGRFTTMADRLAIARRIRTLKRRTARWFTPPVRAGDEVEPFDDPRERPVQRPERGPSSQQRQ